MSNGDGLDPKDLYDLIARLSHCQKAAPGDRIPARDVKEMLQQAGLLEFLLQERPSLIAGAAETIEPQSHLLKSPFAKRFFALAAAIGFSAIVGYNFGANHAITYANLTDAQKNAFNEKSTTRSTKAGDIVEVGSTGAYLPYFSLIYQGCKRSGMTVKCSVKVVDKVNGHYIASACTTDNSYPDRLFDSKGGVYKADTIQFSGEPVNSQRSGDSKCSQTHLPKDVPVKATLTFKNVDPEIKIIKAFEITITTLDAGKAIGNSHVFREVLIE
jgi:hypothetical protein